MAICMMVRSPSSTVSPASSSNRQPANCILRSLRADQYADSESVSMLTQHADLRPVPFVVVLVDGDSYSFLDRNKASGPAGPEIAQNLHREVSKYPQIPPHSKIIVRVFCNRSSLQGSLVNASKAKRGSQPTLVVEKMVKLAETCEHSILCRITSE
jgi:hypothetical protein